MECNATNWDDEKCTNSTCGEYFGELYDSEISDYRWQHICKSCYEISKRHNPRAVTTFRQRVLAFLSVVAETAQWREAREAIEARGSTIDPAEPVYRCDCGTWTQGIQDHECYVTRGMAHDACIVEMRPYVF